MKRIVVKVGSSILTDSNGISKKRMKELVDFIYEIHEKFEIIIVSSGAVAAGHSVIPSIDNKTTSNKQALAAVGQTILIHKYRKDFEEYGINVAQILLTKDDFKSYAHSVNAKNSINTLLAYKIIPIINENDSVVIDELLRGDNDFLSAQVAHYFDADLLVILSDVDAYYSDDPRRNPEAKMLDLVQELTDKDLEQEYSPNYAFATGGIVTKLRAADFLMKNGKKMFLSSGFDLSYVKHFLNTGEINRGTLFWKK